MGYKNDDPCLEKAFNDERLFVLMARDTTSPMVVIEWIKQNLGCQPREKLIEALDCALEMQKRSGEMINRKKYEAEGWIFCTKRLPSPESRCEVLSHDFSIGESTYWSEEEGFEEHIFQVMAWRNPRRAT